MLTHRGAKMSKNLICLTLEWCRFDEDLISGTEDTCIDLELAIKIIGVNKEYDPVMAEGGYEIKPHMLKELQPYFQHKIDLSKYQYFIGRYSNYECVDGKPVRVDP